MATTSSCDEPPSSRANRLGVSRDWVPPNDAMQLTAPLGGRSGNVVVKAAASRSPFGERRRRS